MSLKHVVVDGSNIATEGRTAPSLAQLDDAVRTFIEEYGADRLTVVVDATFGHRIDESERAAYEEAVLAGEVVSPPAGAIGRGDAFVLQIADKAGATVFSNDSFQEFHGDYDWLFDEGRLIGGKPVPEVGWVFVVAHAGAWADQPSGHRGREAPAQGPLGQQRATGRSGQCQAGHGCHKRPAWRCGTEDRRLARRRPGAGQGRAPFVVVIVQAQGRRHAGARAHRVSRSGSQPPFNRHARTGQPTLAVHRVRRVTSRRVRGDGRSRAVLVAWCLRPRGRPPVLRAVEIDGRSRAATCARCVDHRRSARVHRATLRSASPWGRSRTPRLRGTHGHGPFGR